MFSKGAVLAGVAAPMLFLASPAAVQGNAATRTPLSSGGAPAITVSPSLVFAPNQLCDQIGGPGAFPHTVTVTGSGFPAGASTSVTEHGTPVATATNDSTGGFTATYTALAEPAGTYPVLATSGAASAPGTVTSSAYNCWKEVGFVGGTLSWNWEGAGYDPATKAAFRVGGVRLKTAKTSAAGHWSKRWAAACPRSGTLGVTVTATSGGVRQRTSAGTVNC